MACPVQNNLTSKYNGEKAGLSRQKVRNNINKKRMARLRFIIAMILFVSYLLPKLIGGTYDYLFLNKLNNNSLISPKSSLFLKTAEASLLNKNEIVEEVLADKKFQNILNAKSPIIAINQNFINADGIADIDSKEPLMRNLPLNKEMTRLKSRLNNLTAMNTTIKPGIFVMDYQTGNYTSINGDREFATASIIKVPVLLQLFRRSDAGIAKLNDVMTLADYYVSGGSGFLQYRPLGSRFPVKFLAQKMIQESDNTATNMLLSNIGGVNGINKDFRQWGFSRTHMSNWLPDLDGTNVTTPKDMARIFYNIDNPAFLSLNSRVEIVDIMSHVKNRFLIKAGLPENVQFIHKTGDIGNMLGDAGIVILPDGRKYIIVILVERPWNSYTAKQFIIDASKTIYNSYVSRDL